MRRTAPLLLVLALAQPAGASAPTSPTPPSQETTIVTSSGQGFPWGLLGLLGLMGLARRPQPRPCEMVQPTASDPWQLSPEAEPLTTSPLIADPSAPHPAAAPEPQDWPEDLQVSFDGAYTEEVYSVPADTAEVVGYVEDTPAPHEPIRWPHEYGEVATDHWVPEASGAATQPVWAEPEAAGAEEEETAAPTVSASQQGRSRSKLSERLGRRPAGSPDLSKPPKRR